MTLIFHQFSSNLSQSLSHNLLLLAQVLFSYYMTTTYCSLCQKVFNLLVLVASLSLLFPFLKFWLHVKILNKNLTLLSISCQLLLKTSSPANLPNPTLYLFLLLKQLCICHYRLCFIFKEFYVTRIIHTVHTIFSWVFQSVLF